MVMISLPIKPLNVVIIILIIMMSMMMNYLLFIIMIGGRVLVSHPEAPEGK